jgi:hypothetical protein
LTSDSVTSAHNKPPINAAAADDEDVDCDDDNADVFVDDADDVDDRVKDGADVDGDDGDADADFRLSPPPNLPSALPSLPNVSRTLSAAFSAAWPIDADADVDFTALLLLSFFDAASPSFVLFGDVADDTFFVFASFCAAPPSELATPLSAVVVVVFVLLFFFFLFLSRLDSSVSNRPLQKSASATAFSATSAAASAVSRASFSFAT